jgi:hypothetical protein
VDLFPTKSRKEKAITFDLGFWFYKYSAPPACAEGSYGEARRRSGNPDLGPWRPSRPSREAFSFPMRISKCGVGKWGRREMRSETLSGLSSATLRLCNDPAASQNNRQDAETESRQKSIGATIPSDHGVYIRAAGLGPLGALGTSLDASWNRRALGPSPSGDRWPNWRISRQPARLRGARPKPLAQPPRLT